MALGSNSGSPRIFLTVGFGRIRQKSLENKQKVDASTPGAVKRLKQDNTETWAIEHDFVSGIIQSIFYKEDAKYGNSFEVTLQDVADVYQVSFPEDSRFWFDFSKKLTNIDLKQEVKITAYDFVDKENKRRAGVSVEQNGNKLRSFYDQMNPDKSWTLLYGFPSGDGVDFKDKDEIKMYFIKVKKFLRGEFNAKFKDKFDNKPHVAEDNSSAPPTDFVPPTDDDLPF